MNLKFLLGLALISVAAYAAEDDQSRKRSQRPQGGSQVPAAKRQETLGGVGAEGSVSTELQDDVHSQSSSSSSSVFYSFGRPEIGFAAIFNRLCLQGPLSQSIKNNLLLECAKIGDVDFVQFLIAQGADKEAKDNYGERPLHVACWTGHLEVVKCLIEAGANIEAKDYSAITPLYVACQQGHLEVVKYLIAAGANREAKAYEGSTPLYAACANGHLEVVNCLIAQGADIEAKTNNGWTPLYAACENGHLEVVNCLIAKGVDIEAKDRSGWTPLYAACQEGHLEVFNCLIAKGVDIEAKDRSGLTPLHLACQQGHLKVVNCLIAQGADIEAKNIDGLTPLYIACSQGRFSVVKCLIAKGADIEAKTNNGFTPLLVACHYGRLEVVKYLIEEKGLEVTPLTMKEAATGYKMNVLAYLMHKSGKYNGQLECGICLDPIAEHPKTTGCCFNGTYCTQCIAQAAEHKNACPTCRAQGVMQKLIDIQETMAHYVPKVQAGTSTSGGMLPTCSSSDMY